MGGPVRRRTIDPAKGPRGWRPGAARHYLLQAFRLWLATTLALVIATAQVGRAIAGTLEIPQAVPSPLPAATQPSRALGSASPANSAPEIPAGSAADCAAQAAPTSTEKAPPPIPQVAGIDQYMNQGGGPGSGSPPGSLPDPRNNRASSAGGLLMGGLMVGLVALDLAIKHHH